jgi:hypothetical protein
MRAPTLASKNAREETAWRIERDGFRRGSRRPCGRPKPEVAVVAGTLRVVAYNLADGSSAGASADAQRTGGIADRR